MKAPCLRVWARVMCLFDPLLNLTLCTPAVINSPFTFFFFFFFSTLAKTCGPTFQTENIIARANEQR